VRQLGRAKRGERRRLSKPATLQKTYKPSQHRQSPGKGAARDPVLGAAGQIGAEIAGSQCIDCSQARQFAQMLGQKVEEKGEIAAVCGHGMRRGAALPGEPGDP
jgi:hypothetical protein